MTLNLQMFPVRREIVTHFLISGSDLSTVPELFLPINVAVGIDKVIASARKSVLSLAESSTQLSVR